MIFLMCALLALTIPNVEGFFKQTYPPDRIQVCLPWMCKYGFCPSRYGDCHCYSGWTGKFCDIDINECKPFPCLNGGTCNQNAPGQGFSCCCAPGYEGETCEIDIDDCNPDPCFNGGTCRDLVNDFKCTCPAGFSGKQCEVDIDDCNTDSCSNGGTCCDGVNSFTCGCAPGWTGTTCADNIDDCNPDPCFNGGTCSDLVNDFKCTCPAGFSGKQCELDIDECVEVNPCNNGVCINTNGSYHCDCFDTGFVGENCETDCNAMHRTGLSPSFANNNRIAKFEDVLTYGGCCRQCKANAECESWLWLTEREVTGVDALEPLECYLFGIESIPPNNIINHIDCVFGTLRIP